MSAGLSSGIASGSLLGVGELATLPVGLSEADGLADGSATIEAVSYTHLTLPTK
jgi:hypothetical protein